MKTTVEISDDLAKRARDFARRNHTTLRALIEQGLRQVLRDARKPSRFQLSDASVDGRGLQDPFKDADWTKIREAAYEGHGA